MTRTDLELLVARGIQKGIFDIEIKKEQDFLITKNGDEVYDYFEL
jgi:hypothetical protein